MDWIIKNKVEVKDEVRGWRLEVGGWRLEVGGLRRERRKAIVQS
jgi:hypothetical protein